MNTFVGASPAAPTKVPTKMRIIVGTGAAVPTKVSGQNVGLWRARPGIDVKDPA